MGIERAEAAVQEKMKERKRRDKIAQLPSGVWEALGLLAKDAFEEDARAGDEASWWVPRECDSQIDTATACLKLKIAGVSPVEGASLVLARNGRVQTAMLTGQISQTRYKQMITNLSEVIDENTPK